MKTSYHSSFYEKFHGKLEISNSAIFLWKIPAPHPFCMCMEIRGKDNFSFIISEINFKGRMHTVALKETYPYNNRKSNKSFLKTLFFPPWWLLGGFPYLHCRQILHHPNHQGSPKREPSPCKWLYFNKSFRIYLLKPV